MSDSDQRGHELFKQALAEDTRTGGRFDAVGFAQFFRAEKPEDVQAAWTLYCEHRFFRRALQKQFGRDRTDNKENDA
jgi:hypothetical protein